MGEPQRPPRRMERRGGGSHTWWNAQESPRRSRVPALPGEVVAAERQEAAWPRDFGSGLAGLALTRGRRGAHTTQLGSLGTRRVTCRVSSEDCSRSVYGDAL